MKKEKEFLYSEKWLQPCCVAFNAWSSLSTESGFSVFKGFDQIEYLAMLEL